MNNNKSEARVLAEAALAAATQCRAVKQLISGYIARTNPKRVPVNLRSDGEKYRWIRGNRGNHAIADAIAHSDRNKDFDDRIDAAMAQSDRCEKAPPTLLPATTARTELPDEPGHLRLANVDFLATRSPRAAPSPATGEDRAVEGRFDEATNAVCFCVGIAQGLVHASVSASVLRSHYGHGSLPMTLFKKHSSALVEAVRDRVSGGSIELIVLREYDLK